MGRARWQRIGSPRHATLASHSLQTRFRHWLGSEFFAPHEWRRRTALWVGGATVGLAAVVFAKSADLAFAAFHALQTRWPWLPLLCTPAAFALLAWLTEGALRATRGSGIPQVIAALSVEDGGFRQRMLALPVALGKMALTLFALLGGASVGREGPTVHVGGGLMLWIGQRFGFHDPRVLSRFVLAGGGAGVAAAFNTPLAGVVFAIEELAGSFEHRFSGILLTAVIVAGVVALGLLGNYTYFGQVQGHLPLGWEWLALLVCAGVCGVLGGVFARAVLLSGPTLGRLAGWRARHPVRFAALCGMGLAVLGVLSGGVLFGTGYEQAHQLAQGGEITPAFAAGKLAANVLSYWAGIPGGLFAPSLAVGAGLGHQLASWFPGVPGPVMVLLGMAGFLAGVTQAPLTAAVISLELTANRGLAIPIMACCLLARAAAGLVCPQPLYRALAQRLVEADAGPAPAQEASPNRSG